MFKHFQWMSQGWWCKLCGLFERCLKSAWTSQHAHAAVWTLHAAVFEHVLHLFPCVQMVFKQPTVQWCAVQTLFKQFGLVWQSSNTSNSVQTACSCPPPAVSSFHFFFSFFTGIHIHTHPQHADTSTWLICLMPSPCCSKSKLFSFSFLFFVYS